VKLLTKSSTTTKTLSPGKSEKIISRTGRGELCLFVFKSDSDKFSFYVNIDGNREDFPDISTLYSANLTSRNNVLWVRSYSAGDYSVELSLRCRYSKSIEVGVTNGDSAAKSLLAYVLVLIEEQL